MLKELSIIIPTLNEEKFLPKLLNSIANQNFAGKLEVIVVDGKSEDTTVHQAHEFKTKIADLTVLPTDRGLSYQRNMGAKQAKYEYLLFLDSDEILPHGFLNRLAKKFPGDKDFIGFVFHLPTEFNLFDYFFTLQVFLFMAVRRLFGEPLIGGMFMFTSKLNHNELRGFTEGVVIGEDMDYLKRSLKRGARYYFYYFPFSRASTRRMRKEGRIRLLLKWYQCYRYINKTGQPIFDEDRWKYPYGHY